MRKLRGDRLAMVYQDPMTSLNPLMRIGDQVTEAMTAHGVKGSRGQGSVGRAARQGRTPGPAGYGSSLPA